MQRDSGMKHARFYCCGRNPQNLCGFSDRVFPQSMEFHNLSSSRPQPRNGGVHNPSPFAKRVSLFRVGSAVLDFSVGSELK
jgi:hypothetical protein